MEHEIIIAALKVVASHSPSSDYMILKEPYTYRALSELSAISAYETLKHNPEMAYIMYHGFNDDEYRFSPLLCSYIRETLAKSHDWKDPIAVEIRNRVYNHLLPATQKKLEDVDYYQRANSMNRHGIDLLQFALEQELYSFAHPRKI